MDDFHHPLGFKHSNKAPFVIQLSNFSMVIVRPIVYGSIAFFLGKQDDAHTHRWSIYVRGLEDEDLSYFIKKVVFHLHPSCKQATVTCEEPPYVTTQTGWGEFNATITLYFRDEQETSVVITHALSLYPPGMGVHSMVNQATLAKKPVVCEFYDEIVFNSPTPAFETILTSPCDNLVRNVSPEELRPHFVKFNEASCMGSIVAAQNLINAELEEACQQLNTLKDEIKEMRDAKNKEKLQQKELTNAVKVENNPDAIPAVNTPIETDVLS